MRICSLAWYTRRFMRYFGLCYYWPVRAGYIAICWLRLLSTDCMVDIWRPLRRYWLISSALLHAFISFNDFGERRLSPIRCVSPEISLTEVIAAPYRHRLILRALMRHDEFEVLHEFLLWRWLPHPRRQLARWFYFSLLLLLMPMRLLSSLFPWWMLAFAWCSNSSYHCHFAIAGAIFPYMHHCNWPRTLHEVNTLLRQILVGQTYLARITALLLVTCRLLNIILLTNPRWLPCGRMRTFQGPLQLSFSAWSVRCNAPPLLQR